jgi:hypothetical protein
MSDPVEQADTAGTKRGLREAIRRVRLVTTEQADGLADLRDAERARLELLADGLADLVAEVPDVLDFFAFALSNGETPRLWIDMTCHVALGRDRRTYRLLKDTRFGRSVLFESADRDEMTVRITDYVAERVLDHTRAIEGDWVELKVRSERVAELPSAATGQPGLKQPDPRDAANEDIAGNRPRRAFRRRAGIDDGAADSPRSGGQKVVFFVLGLLLGAGALAGWMMVSGRL